MNAQDLQNAVKYIYPAAKYPGSFTMTVDSSNAASIMLWDESLGAKPTAQQLTDALAALTLASLKSAKNSSLIASYSAQRFGAPIAITTAAGPSVTFPTDTLTQQNVSGYLVAYDANTWPSGGAPLEAADGSVPMLARADVQALAKAIADQSIATWTKLKGLLAQVAAATTADQVNAITW